MFVTFEGVEGSGKTSNLVRVHDKLSQWYSNIVRVREPGGTPTGNALREILLHGYSLPPIAEACIVAASRACLLQEVVLPVLQEGSVILCDRYVDTTYVIQGYGLGLDLDFLRMLCGKITNGLVPDLTFLIDIDPPIGNQRKTKQDEYCHMDDRALALGEIYRAGYRELMLIDPVRWHVLDGTRPLDELVDEIYWRILGHSTFNGKPRPKELVDELFT
jgi:dTMP kinase